MTVQLIERSGHYVKISMQLASGRSDVTLIRSYACVELRASETLEMSLTSEPALAKA